MNNLTGKMILVSLWKAERDHSPHIWINPEKIQAILTRTDVTPNRTKIKFNNNWTIEVINKVEDIFRSYDVDAANTQAKIIFSDVANNENQVTLVEELDEELTNNE